MSDRLTTAPTEQEYNLIDAERWTNVKELGLSPRHYIHKKRHGIEDTVALRKGRAVHTLVLQPERFELDYAVWHAKRSGPEWKAFEREHQGKTLLNSKEEDESRAMAESLLDARVNSFAAEILRGPGLREGVVQWTNELTGRPCKARFDLLTPGGCKVELKTARYVDQKRFGIQAANLQYHAQDAFHSEGILANGMPLHARCFVVVESKPPYDVAVYRLNPEDIDAGKRRVDKLMRLLAKCTATNEWPGVCPDVEDLLLPEWSLGEDIELEVDGEVQSI